VATNFFKTRKLLKALRYQLKMVKSFLNRAVSFVKKIFALLILWVFSMNGKSYKTRQEESMPMNLPEI
jgi:hypothetical protein